MLTMATPDVEIFGDSLVRNVVLIYSPMAATNAVQEVVNLKG